MGKKITPDEILNAAAEVINETYPTFGHTAQPEEASPIDPNELLMVSFVGYLFDLTAEHLPKPEQIIQRAKSWLKLLGPDFFRKETRYVVEVCCRLRFDRRGPIMADEILRVAEKVYGLPRQVWGMADADATPMVWSHRESEWIPLSLALDRLFQARLKTNPTLKFEQVEEELLQIIYGGAQ